MPPVPDADGRLLEFGQGRADAGGRGSGIATHPRAMVGRKTAYLAGAESGNNLIDALPAGWLVEYPPARHGQGSWGRRPVAVEKVGIRLWQFLAPLHLPNLCERAGTWPATPASCRSKEQLIKRITEDG